MRSIQVCEGKRLNDPLNDILNSKSDAVFKMSDNQRSRPRFVRI